MDSEAAKPRKGVGLTASERYLASLCATTFLSLWSYPNVFRDQGRVNGKGDGKELCDLLVIFGEDVVIFSDKSCAFPSTGDLNLDWRRWHKRAVLKSAEQTYGAERWLRTLQDRLFLDPSCSTPLPVPLPPPDRIRVHRVVVALNAATRCRQYFAGGSGSLIVESPRVESADDPFRIRVGDFPKGFVHVFDDIGLNIVLQELDTVSDFLAYLRKKEAALTNGAVRSATGEEELLGFYLKDINQAGEHDFVVPAGKQAVLLEGLWARYAESGERRRKREADRESYIWDRLIEHFTKFLVAGTLQNPHDNTFADIEQCIRVMASENRVGRRILGRNVCEKRIATTRNQRGARVMISPRDPTVAFLLLFVPRSPFDHEVLSREEYRAMRGRHLEDYCEICFLEYPSINTIVGIATEPDGWEKPTEEFMLAKRREFTPDEIADLREAQSQMRILIDAGARSVHTRESEYPPVSTPLDGPPSAAALDVRARDKKARKRQSAARRRKR